MALYDIKKLLSENSYPGRGIVVGKSADGKNAMIAYFIMGRSANSRNRIFERFDGGMRTKAFDESKLEDPSLIIYNPYLSALGGHIDIITNGDQTNTVYDYINEHGEDGFSFEKSLHTREFEPDAPNFTPRISGILYYSPTEAFHYKLSILKSNNGDPSGCNRYTYTYENPKAGEGRFIHTYMHDGNPLPSFEGEPKLVEIDGDIDSFTEMVWTNLNEENKVSLFVRFIDIATGEYETRIINKNN